MNSVKTELIHDTDGRMLAFRNLGNLLVKPDSGESDQLRKYIEQSYGGFEARTLGMGRVKYFEGRLAALCIPFTGVTRRIAQFGIASQAGVIQPEATSITKLQNDDAGNKVLVIGTLDTRAGQIKRSAELQPGQRDYEKLAAGLLYLDLAKTITRTRGIPLVEVQLFADSPDISWYESLGLMQTGESHDGVIAEYGVASARTVIGKLAEAYPVLHNLSA